MKLERNAQAPGRRVDLNAWAMAGVLAAMWLVLSILPATRNTFLTHMNFEVLLSQSAVLLVVAVGMTMVILIRGIDLSVGAGVALTGVVAGLVHVKLGLPAPVAIAASIGCGAAIGAWHGLWIGWLGVPAFVATLAGFKAYRGAALVLSHGTSITMGDDFRFLNGHVPPPATWAIVGGALALGIGFVLRDAQRRTQLGLESLTSKQVAARLAGPLIVAALVLAAFASTGVPVVVLVAGLVALFGVFVTKRTRFGRHLYAIGGNPDAARLSGIAVRRTTMGVYILLGVLTAIAGLLLAARTNDVTPGNQGQLLELDAVTAVVIGGTSLSGGRGSVVGTVLGTLVFGTLARGMNILQIDSNWQWICTGCVLLVAVLIDVLSKGKRS